jgi:hypothetical protein
MISSTTAKLLIGCSGIVVVVGVAFAYLISVGTATNTASIPDTDEGRRFLEAFDQSVRECIQEESMAQVDIACDAAMLCHSESASQTVEQKCLDAYSRGHRMEQLVAFYVLLEWNRTVRPETKAELRELMLKSVPAEGRREGIKYLLDHFEKLEQGAKQQSPHSESEGL